MAALSAPLETSVRLGPVGRLLKIPLAANVKVWAGSLVMIDAGYLKPAATATGKLAAGRCVATVDNTGGSAGAKVAEVECDIAYKLKNSASGDLIAQADVYTTCYMVDDQTVAKTDGTGTRSKAGIVFQVESDGVFVLTRPPAP